MVSTNSIFHIERIKSLYNDATRVTHIEDNLGPYNSTKFPYNSIPIMILLENRGLGPIEIRAN